MPNATTPAVSPARSKRHWVVRALRVPMSTGPVSGVVSIAVQLVACLALSWLLGGTDGRTPHWYYLPIMFAALRFGVFGAFVTATAAGVLAGPLTALNIAEGVSQPVGQQITQLISFVVVGVGVALIIERTTDITRRELSGHELSDRIATAIAQGDIRVQFQPIWADHRGDEQIVGAEALVRWTDDEFGVVPPGTFVPVLEETDRLGPLGMWVLDESCRHLAMWQTTGADDDGEPGFHVSVNVSGVQLDEGFPDLVESALTRAGADPSGLVLELTERTLLEDKATAVSILATVRAMGVRIAIDDFGTGYSSLAYLRDLDFDILKIDRAFINTLGSAGPDGENVDTMIVRAVIDLAHKMDKEVIVEGVESRYQLEHLRALGPVNIQGAHLAPAMSAAHLTEQLDGGHDVPPSDSVSPLRPPQQPTVRAQLTSWLRRKLSLSPATEHDTASPPAQTVLAGMFLAGSLLVLAVIVFNEGRAEQELLVLGLAALPCAWFLHYFRHRLPEWVLHALVVVATGLIVAATATDPVPTTTVAISSLLIWITVYASAFFRVRAAVAHGILAATGLAVVLRIEPVEQHVAVWLLVVGTAGVAGFVVGWFARRLRSLAATDVLTGLPNRQAFDTMLAAEIDRAQRSDAPLAVALVDLDDFKSINDTSGHQAGDQVLAALPEQWRQELRAHDVLARYGGDEFVVLLPNCPLDDAAEVLGRMGRAGRPTCSVGVAALAWNESPETLLARADAALYQAKSEQAVVRADHSVPTEHAVGGTGRQTEPVANSRE